MHLELVVPGLLDLGTRTAGARCASLELLVARGRRDKATPQSLESWLQQAFDQRGRLNAGPISLLGAGGAPGDLAWTRADPVHLEVRRERVLMVPATALTVSQDEADALCDGLTRHFAGTLEFRALDPHRWCARLIAADMDLGDEPPLAAAGREATGGPEDALLTEVQMLLHAHPTNAAREARGEPVLNSAWFWGSGRLPRGGPSRWQSVTSADPFALGLARLAGATARKLPPNATAWLSQSAEEGRHLVVLDPAETLERDWFAPLAAALRSGQIGMLTLHVPDAGLSFETVRGDLRRFWRRPKALASYV